MPASIATTLTAITTAISSWVTSSTNTPRALFDKALIKATFANPDSLFALGNAMAVNDWDSPAGMIIDHAYTLSRRIQEDEEWLYQQEESQDNQDLLQHWRANINGDKHLLHDMLPAMFMVDGGKILLDRLAPNRYHGRGRDGLPSLNIEELLNPEEEENTIPDSDFETAHNRWMEWDHSNWYLDPDTSEPFDPEQIHDDWKDHSGGWGEAWAKLPLQEREEWKTVPKPCGGWGRTE